MKRYISNEEAQHFANVVASKIRKNLGLRINGKLKIFGVPRGGIPAAYLVRAALVHFCDVEMVEDVADAQVIVDDLIDSGETAVRYSKLSGAPFYALLDKREQLEQQWIVFPWEQNGNGSEETVEDNIRRLLQYIDPQPTRGGLLETPSRVAKALEFWFGGYRKQPADILKVFEDGGEKYDQMIVVKDIPTYSHCEHHMAPIFGVTSVAYIPNGRIVGLSKLSRLVDIYARRLQVQERLTDQIADALMEHVKPIGVGVIVRARHMCMESRGVCQQGHQTITTALRGAIKNEEQTRAEFLQLVQ